MTALAETAPRRPPPPPRRARLLDAARHPRSVGSLSLAVTVSILALIGSGGWVRLSESGLGCPTWPDCTSTALVAPARYHALVEFTNRCVISTVGLLVAATVVAALLRRPRRADLRWLSAGLLAGYLGEAVLGGVTVLLHLNPALVAAHLVLAMLLLADAVVLRSRARLRPGAEAGQPGPDGRPDLTWDGAGRVVAALSALMVAAVAVGIVAGTVATGSGPRAGAPGTPRFDLPFRATAELHASVAMFLSGITVALWLVLRAARAGAPVVRRFYSTVALMAAQGALGYATYLTRVGPGVTELHILGGAVLLVATLRFHLMVGSARPRRPADRTGRVRSAAGPSAALGEPLAGGG